MRRMSLRNVHDVLDATEVCVFFLHGTLEKTIDGAIENLVLKMHDDANVALLVE